MSKIKGLVHLIHREGDNGKIGPIKDAIQVVAGSPIIPILKDRDYYIGAKEEWEDYTGLTAGDMDADGDYDADDRKIIKEL